MKDLRRPKCNGSTYPAVVIAVTDNSQCVFHCMLLARDVYVSTRGQALNPVCNEMLFDCYHVF